MTIAIRENHGISKQRGFRLRCFLDGALLAAIAMSSVTKSSAMTCVISRVQVIKLQGEVFDPGGAPIPQCKVTILRDGAAIAETRTDEMGHFVLNMPDGAYDLKVEMTGFHGLSQTINVTHDVLRIVHPGHLRVILGLGGFNCPFATTSQREFDEELTAVKARLNKTK